MFKKVLSAALALTMALSMAVSSSAATVKKTTTSTTSTKTTAATDICKSQLSKDKLALDMHNKFLAGLKANKNKITVSVKGYTQAQINAAFQKSLQMIFDQHPEIFWLDPSMQNIVISSDKNTLTFYPRPVAAYGKASTDGKKASTINATAIKNTKASMDAAVKKMTGSTKYEQVKAIHDAIVNGTHYPKDPDKAVHNDHQAVGPLTKGQGVCDGYAKAFKYACDQKGISCIIVTGTASNAAGDKGTHAWNYVKMEDGKWYQVDTDWDDPQIKGRTDYNKPISTYFLTGTVKNDKRVKDKTLAYPKLATASYKAK